MIPTMKQIDEAVRWGRHAIKCTYDYERREADGDEKYIARMNELEAIKTESMDLAEKKMAVLVAAGVDRDGTSVAQWFAMAAGMDATVEMDNKQISDAVYYMRKTMDGDYKPFPPLPIEP